MRGRLARALALIAGVAAPLAAQEVAYEGGLSAATGRYIFTERTTTWTLLTGLVYTSGRLTVRGTFPLVLQNSTLVTRSGMGGVPSGGSSSGMVSQHGSRQGSGSVVVHAVGTFGRTSHGGRGPVSVPASTVTSYEFEWADPVAQIGVRVLDGLAWSVGAGMAAKLPLTDTTSVGTGEWDVGGSLAVTRMVGLSLLLGLDVSYWHLGDLPNLDFRDPVLGTLTATTIRDSWGLSASASGGTSALRGFDAPFTLGLAVARLGRGTLIGGNVAFGLSETVPDVAIGLQWRVAL